MVGEFTRLWNRMGPVIDKAVAESVLMGDAPRVRPAAAEPSVARLRGTVAMVLQKHFGPQPRAERRQRSSRPRLEARLQ